MRMRDIKGLGLLPKTIEESDLDVTRLIVSDEFNRGTPYGSEKSEYRERAIDRLVKDELPFYNEDNITSNMGKRFIKAICPYCSSEMETKGGGGTGSHSYLAFKCSCGASGSIRVTHGTFSFAPPDKKD